MEKIIFFGLVIPILAFVLYLGGNAIMNGMSAKKENKNSDLETDTDQVDYSLDEKKDLSDEIEKLNKLLNEGILTQEEFEKAKKKILED
tara:strand:+ start:70 stop:336 length:267 start_codon:yes stop_codon:yes gene_type:complete